MFGLMMESPLLIPHIIEYAGKYFPKSQVISRNEDNSFHQYGYEDCLRRTRQLAQGLKRLGLAPGDRVATLAWNNYRHLELYYAVPGMGFVCHTINPRLFVEQIVYIINHAKDRYIFVDPSIFPLVAKLYTHLPTVRGVVVMCDRAHMPQSDMPHLLCYEELLEGDGQSFDWPEFDERTASGLCYTSGTTGNPKGVLYTHRSTVLHALVGNQPSLLNYTEDEVVMPVVPMFHVNAWGIPYNAPMAGANLVMPGPRLDGAGMLEAIQKYKVTATAGVPTLWTSLLNHAEATSSSLSPLKRAVVGGAACPQSLIERFDAHKVQAIQAWGMTETSPLGSVSLLTKAQKGLSAEAKMEIQLKQGRAPFGIEMRITDANGKVLPWDGQSSGLLEVRGPWVTSGYFENDDRDSFSADGWFSTGDIATIDQDASMHIVDRAKDVIKSGGEWISSIELENLAMSHPSVLEAAVIARQDRQWSERPRLLVMLHEGKTITGAELRRAIEPHVAKWWLPEDFIIVKEIPHSATGKILKTALRELYGKQDHPDAQPL